MSSGYFEAWTNSIAATPTDLDCALVQRVEQEARAVLDQPNIRWSGSNHTRTAIKGSDLDLFILSGSEVTHAQRRSLARALEVATGRSAQILSHAIRLHGQPTVDISFASSFFGERDAPDRGGFFDRAHRQQAVRALKYWSRRPGLPGMKGWVAEAIVCHLDQQQVELSGCALFQKVLTWLSGTNPAAVESVLRPVSQFEWPEEWTQQLAGTLIALQNDARRLLKRDLQTSPFRSTQDVEDWLHGR